MLHCSNNVHTGKSLCIDQFCNCSAQFDLWPVIKKMLGWSWFNTIACIQHIMGGFIFRVLPYKYNIAIISGFLFAKSSYQYSSSKSPKILPAALFDSPKGVVMVLVLNSFFWWMKNRNLMSNNFDNFLWKLFDIRIRSSFQQIFDGV